VSNLLQKEGAGDGRGTTLTGFYARLKQEKKENFKIRKWGQRNTKRASLYSGTEVKNGYVIVLSYYPVGLGRMETPYGININTQEEKLRKTNARR